MKSQLEEPRSVAVDVPARIKIMQNAKMDSISIAQMIDPLTQSEVARLEDRVIALEKSLAQFNQFADQFLTYKQATEKLAEEIAAYHKLGILKNDSVKEATDVVRITASAFGIHSNQLLSRQRPAHVAIPRMVAMYIFRKRLGLTLQEIGKFFKRDHGTAIHAIKVIEKILKAKNPNAQEARVIEKMKIIEGLVPVVEAEK